MSLEGGKHGFGLNIILDRLKKYEKESNTEQRSSNILRRIRSYSSLKDARQEFSQGINIYKKVLQDKQSLQDKELYELFEKTVYDKSSLHPMEEVEIKTQYNYHLDGTPSSVFREKTLKYLKTYTEDVFLANLFYDHNSNKPDKTVKVENIKKVFYLLDNKSGDFHKMIKGLDDNIVSAYYIIESLYKNFTYFPYVASEQVKIMSRKELHQLIRSIDDPQIRNFLLNKFSSFRAPKKSRPEPKPFKVEIKKLLSESPDYKKIQREKNKIYKEFERLQIPEYEARRKIINLLPYFSYGNYQERVGKTLKDLYGKRLTNGEIKKISLSMRDIHKDIRIEKEGFIDQLDRSFEKYLQTPDNFRELNKTIIKFMFEKYQSLSNKKIEFFNFIRMPGVKVITETLRKDYLLSKLKKLIEKKGKNPVIFPQDVTISNNISLLKKIFSENPRQLLNPKFTDKLEDLFSDEDLAACWIYFSIENKLKRKKNDLNNMMITKKGAELELDTDIDYLVPRKAVNNIDVGQIKIPVISQLRDYGKDNYFIYLFSLNRLITIIPIQRLEYR